MDKSRLSFLRITIYMDQILFIEGIGSEAGCTRFAHPLGYPGLFMNGARRVSGVMHTRVQPSFWLGGDFLHSGRMRAAADAAHVFKFTPTRR